ncbi:BMP family ABC transporter substrate-binding protein [Plantibacter sp. RU18]
MSRAFAAVRLGCISLAAGLALLVGGCSATGSEATTPLVATSPTQAVIAPQPAPGATSTPDPSSWDAVVAPAGFTATVVTVAEAGVDPEVDAAVAAVTARAGAGARVTRATLGATATASGDSFAGVLADTPDLVIVLGPELLDATDRSSASNLGQQYLVIGAQLPEPTANVTAVVWAGADARRIDEPRSVPNGMSDLAAHADDAFRAGLSALLTDTTGGVLILP